MAHIIDDLTVENSVSLQGGAVAAPVTQTPDQANAAGTATSISRSDHVHNIPTAAPTTTLSPATNNAQGSGSSFAKNDHTHAVATALATDITTIQPNDTASAGTANTFARGDHKHAIATASAVGLTGSSTNTQGVASTFARSDHTHSVTLTKTDVGLGNVDNTSDTNKPVSTAQAAANAAVQAYAIQRSNHTGTQTASTISDFNTAASAAAPVQSVFGRTGTVVAATNDYTWAQINKTTSSLADITTRSATDLTSGTLADARLSSNVPLKNTANTFTANQTISVTGAPSILNIASNGSTTNYGNIVFTGTAGTGDLRISGDGGDLYWQGGGGRALQMAAYHQVDLMGGRNSTTAPAFLAGSNGTYNTRILNSNDSIGLVIRGNAGQTANLLQARNSGETVLAGITAAGNAFGQDPTVSNHYATKNYVDTVTGVWTELISLSDVTNASNTTQSAITDLSINVTAGKTYRYEATIIYESTVATTGLAITLNTQDTAAGTIAMTARMVIGNDGTAAEYGGAITSLGDLVIGTDVPATNTRTVCTIIGMFVCTTSGTIRPQFRREATGLGTVTVRAGSCVLSREF